MRCILVCVALAACDREAPAPAPAPASASAAAPPPASASTPPAESAPLSAVTSTATIAPAPTVRVDTIGIHVGGGPNDDATHAFFAKSVSAHTDELRACWAHVGDGSRGGTFGVDLLVPAAGGRPSVSNPRTALGPEEFRACALAVFASVEFPPPRTGKTTLSYSVKFTP